MPWREPLPGLEWEANEYPKGWKRATATLILLFSPLLVFIFFLQPRLGGGSSGEWLCLPWPAIIPMSGDFLLPGLSPGPYVYFIYGNPLLTSLVGTCAKRSLQRGKYSFAVSRFARNGISSKKRASSLGPNSAKDPGRMLAMELSSQQVYTTTFLYQDANARRAGSRRAPSPTASCITPIDDPGRTDPPASSSGSLRWAGIRTHRACCGSIQIASEVPRGIPHI